MTGKRICFIAGDYNELRNAVEARRKFDNSYILTSLNFADVSGWVYFDISKPCEIRARLKDHFREYNPDMIFFSGDSILSYSAALALNNDPLKIKVLYEVGLDFSRGSKSMTILACVNSIFCSSKKAYEFYFVNRLKATPVCFSGSIFYHTVERTITGIINGFVPPMVERVSVFHTGCQVLDKVVLSMVSARTIFTDEPAIQKIAVLMGKRICCKPGTAIREIEDGSVYSPSGLNGSTIKEIFLPEGIQGMPLEIIKRWVDHA